MTRDITHSLIWITIKNPTTTEEGLAQKKCTICGYIAEEFTMPMLVADFVTGVSVSPKTVALNVGETANISAIITPETAQNKNIIWSSTDSESVSVSNGNITALRPGVTFIIAETEDGGYKDFCHVRVIGIKSANGSVVDSDSGLIYGLAPKINSVESFIDTLDESLSLTCDDDIIGTGSVIQIVRNGEPIDTYRAVIFGDLNSDGIYDGQDAFIVNCIANGLLTKEQVGEAKWMAADCNHDGEINAVDVAILEQAGLLLSEVDQTMSTDELMETQSYQEYLNLIDQNPDADETPIEEPSEPEAKPQTIIDKIIEMVKYIISIIRSVIKL